MEGRATETAKTDTTRKKQSFSSIAERNRTLERIFGYLQNGDDFLLLGHEQPDEDCISSSLP